MLGFSRSLAKIVVSSIGSVVGTIGIGVVKTGVHTGVTISIGAVEKSGVSLSVSLGLGFGRSLAKIVVSSIGSVVGTIGIGVVKTRVHTGVTISIGAVEKSGVSISVSLGL